MKQEELLQLGKKLQTISEKIFKVIGQKKTIQKKADIFLLPHREMLRLKKKFLPREKGSPNVLAFPEQGNWPEPAEKTKKLGEIYLNRDSARGDVRELERLLVHGLLHLLGYDHKRRSDRMEMEKLEKEITGKLVFK